MRLPRGGSWRRRVRIGRGDHSNDVRVRPAAAGLLLALTFSVAAPATAAYAAKGDKGARLPQRGRDDHDTGA